MHARRSDKSSDKPLWRRWRVAFDQQSIVGAGIAHTSEDHRNS
jgi:hypothetical protein